MCYELDGEDYRTPIKTLRGDRKGSNGETINDLRLWDKSDFAPRPDDLFQERLYSIQWITKETVGKPRQATFFHPQAEDEVRERKVHEFVKANLAHGSRKALCLICL